MSRISALAVLLALAVLAPSPAAGACADSGLAIGVRDLQGAPVAGVVFAIEVAGVTQAARTDAAGLATLTVACAAEGDPVAHIRRATRADGTRLVMDETRVGEGLDVPLVAGGAPQLPLLLADTLLFVEPVAEADLRADATPVATSTDGAASAAPAMPVTRPIPAPSRPAWFWALAALAVAAPLALALLRWYRTTPRARRGR